MYQVMCFFLVLTGKGNIFITNCMVSLNEDIYFRKFYWPILRTVSVMAWGWLDLSESPEGRKKNGTHFYRSFLYFQLIELATKMAIYIHFITRNPLNIKILQYVKDDTILLSNLEI